MSKGSNNSVSDIVKSWYRDRNRWTEATWTLEFKSGKNGFPKTLWETYSAFANTNGGIIVVGVDNNGVLEGIKTVEKYREEFSNMLSSGTKCNTILCSEEDIAIVELVGREVLAIRVKAAAVAQKPVYLDGNPTKCYVRVGEGDRRCTAEEISRMLRDKDVVTCQYSADADIIPNSGPEDLDPETLQQYRTDLRSSRRQHPWAALDDDALLTKLGAYRKDRKTGEVGLTLAGLLMFGRSETIKELHPIFCIDYFEQDGNEKTSSRKRWVDRITNDGTWEANLYQFFHKVLPRLTDDLKRPFQLGVDLKRKDDSTAYEAIREALANAIIHADYRSPGGVKITKLPSGLILENSGKLLMSKEEVYAGGNSLCRNKNMQTMFKLVGIVEEAGSGVDVLMRGWSENFLCLPYVNEDLTANKVIWSLPYLAMLQKNVLLAQQEFLGYEKYGHLSTQEKILLLMIPHDKFVSNQELRVYLSSIHAVDLGKILSHLRDEGYLQSKGRSNATKYRLSDKLAERIKLLDNVPLATANVGSNVGSNVRPEAYSQVAKDLDLPVELMEEIELYRQSNKNPRHLTDSLILHICTHRQVTMLQLSILLNRETEPLRRDFVAPLVRHKKLRFTEESKHSSGQSYTTAVNDEKPS